MEIKGIGALVSEEASSRPGFWRAFYDDAASFFAGAGFTFLNLGYLDPSDPTDLEPDDSHISERLSERLYEQVVDDLDLTGKIVLEVGCGQGGGCVHLARAHHAAEVIGIDGSPRLIEFCKASHNLPNVRFEVGDAGRLPLANASVDVVVNVESSHCYRSRLTFLCEVSRVLRPGGRLAFADLLFPNAEASRPDEIEALLRRSGLEVDRGMAITPGVLRARTAASRSRSYRRHLVDVHKQGADAFWEGFCLVGSRDYEAMRRGTLEYWRWIAVKPSAATTATPSTHLAGDAA